MSLGTWRGKNVSVMVYKLCIRFHPGFMRTECKVNSQSAAFSDLHVKRKCWISVLSLVLLRNLIVCVILKALAEVSVAVREVCASVSE